MKFFGYKKNLFKNGISFKKPDKSFEISDNFDTSDLINQQKENIQPNESPDRAALYNKIIDYYSNNPSDDYKKELTFFKNNGQIQVFPYAKVKSMPPVKAEYDFEKRMPYILHKEHKKLYFPKSWGVEQAVARYSKYIESENLLGGDYSEKSPHQYLSDKIFVKKNDIVFDVGSAEALFALEVIDLAKKMIIIEEDEMWVEPLKATFEPYREKVTIINKRLSNVDTHDQVTLESTLENEELGGLFIKMDIEGYEVNAIRENEILLKKNIDLRAVCCTYHGQNDAEALRLLFTDFGYETEFSNGYMLFVYDSQIQPPFFRKGVIRAKKVNG